MQKALAGFGIALALTFGGAVSSSAVTLNEFNNAGQEQKGQVISAILQAYHKHYSSNDETAYKAQCMVDLYKPAADGSGAPLIHFIISDIDKASSEPEKYTVESIVENIINRECDSTNTAKIPKPSKSEPG